MESIKRVMMNIFAGQQWRHRQRQDLWTRAAGEWKERVRRMERGAQKHIR